MHRETRSGKTFGQWDGGLLMAANPDFDFPNLLQESTALEELLFEKAELGEFSLSPLSSPDHSRPSSPEPDRLPLPATETRPDPRRSSSPQPAASTTPTARPSLTTPSNLTPAQLRHKRKIKEASKENVKRRRLEKFSYHALCPTLEEKHVKSSTPVATASKLSESKVTSTAFSALNDVKPSEKEYTLGELVGPESRFQFKLVPWKADKSLRVVGPDGILTAVLVSFPDDPDWPRLIKEGEALLADAGERCNLKDEECLHRRGAFKVLRCGVSHGGGQKCPSNLKNSRQNREIVEELCAAEPFRRLVGLATSVMAHWAPKLHCHYCKALSALHSHDPSLKRLFPHSVFAAASFNLGPRTVCFKHKDHANLPYGWCAITAFGNYDSTKSGHLILWDCGLVIEFPAGATILLPSATVAHSNIPISEGETRFSFAQYTAGALFRWVDNDFQKQEDYYAKMSKEQAAEEQVKRERRWVLGLSLLPCFDVPSSNVNI